MAPPLKDANSCFMHSPEHALEVQEARQLGGYRRKREAALSAEYDFYGLSSVADIRRLLEVAVTDTLALENSLSRNRTLGYLAQLALKALEAHELTERIAILEQAVLNTNVPSETPIFTIMEGDIATRGE